MKETLTHDGIKYHTYQYAPSSVHKNNLLLPYENIKYFHCALPPEILTCDGETLFISHDTFHEIVLIKKEFNTTTDTTTTTDTNTTTTTTTTVPPNETDDNDDDDDKRMKRMICKIPLVKRFDVWGELLKNYLDNDEQRMKMMIRKIPFVKIFDVFGYLDKDEMISKTLLKNKANIDANEYDSIHEKVGKAMFDYNFTSMLLEWDHLGMGDVLDAMSGKLSGDKHQLPAKEFETFYWYVMSLANQGEIDNNLSQNELIEEAALW